MSEILLPNILGIGAFTFFTLIFWNVFWMGWALWLSARKNSKSWFLIFLLVNTLGILEIVYIFYLSKKDILKNLDLKLDKFVESIRNSLTRKYSKKDYSTDEDKPDNN